MHTAQFTSADIAQAIAQSQVETLPYAGKGARKEQREYTVRAIMGKGKGAVQIVDRYIAYSEGDAIAQFKEDYAPGKDAQVSARRTILSKS